MSKLLVVDPKDFTAGQWEEAFAAGGDSLLRVEFRRNAVPVKASRKKVLMLAALCRAKALRIAYGEFGPEEEKGENASWIGDLRGAARVLEVLSQDSANQARIHPGKYADEVEAMREAEA